jgi:hypothetical protein
MGHDGKSKFNNMSVFSLSNTVLLRCVRTSELMGYLKKLSFTRFEFDSSIRS